MRVLLIEDDSRLADALARGLRDEGFAVDVANDGREGLWRATENPYDAVVCDVMLPRLNGYQICERMRAAEVWTPVLMLTALSGKLDEAEALDLGADDYLSKPFSLVVLLARLRALLRRGEPSRPALLTAGDLHLDPARHLVVRGQCPISLSPRQFALLELLMRRAGDVLSKREILDHVWDGSYDGDPNIVEVYVSQLRRKIDQPFGRAAVQTLRGVGYLLDPDGG